MDLFYHIVAIVAVVMTTPILVALLILFVQIGLSYFHLLYLNVRYWTRPVETLA